MADFLARTDWIPVLTGVTSWSFSFPYIREEHVYVFVRNIADDPDEVPEVPYTGTITFLDSSLISLSPAPTTAQEIQIRRITPASDLLTRFDTPGPINKSELNAGLLQLLYVLQEAFDAALSVQEQLALLSNLYTVALDAIAVGGAIAYQYDIALSIPYPPNDGDRLLVQPIVRPITLPVSATGSLAVSSVAASGDDVILSIRKNNVEVGTITFDDGETEGTFSVGAAVDFAIGDVLSILCTQTDGTIENFGVTLRCARNGDLS